MDEKKVHSSQALSALADCELDMEKAENDVQIYRLNQLRGIYEKRDEIIQRIPKFWRIVLSQNDDFANYIRASDFKYVDAIESLIVKWEAPNDYEIILKFKGIENELKSQTVKKHFMYEENDLHSEPAEVDYPSSKTNDDSGVKSLFDWFRWTGTPKVKEFANGGEFATLISEDIYPYCVKYYTEAQCDILDEESCSDSSEGELIPAEH